MSRSAARLKLTSSLSKKMDPEVGNSSPAIILSVVVLPHPDGPSRQKNSPLSTVRVDSLTATKSPNALCSFSTLIFAMMGKPQSGNFVTTTNSSTPARIVTNEYE